MKPVVRLLFNNGGELRCTANHRLWTLNRGYVPAEELTTEDRVLLNDSPTEPTAASWELPVAVEALARSSARGGSTTYKRLPRRWSESLAELTGHLIGDGCLTDLALNWVYGGDDVDDGVTERHGEWLRDLVGSVSRQEMSNGTVQLRVGSSAVRELFRGIGVSSARAHEKRVPESIFKAPREVQAAFLRGLYGADGCVSRVELAGKATRYAGLGSRSHRLLGDVQTMLSAFGIRSRLYRVSDSDAPSFSYERKDGTVVEYTSREGFDLRVTGSDLERFASEVGFSMPRKQAALESMLGECSRYATKRHVCLATREIDGQETVYNLSEPLHHSYIVDGVLVANCSEYMHVDDSACNLASLNLMRFRRADGSFDVPAFKHTVDIMLLAQEIVVGPSSYPTEQIGVNARAFRQLGLGYANLGALPDGRRHALRLRRGTDHRRRDHRADDGPRLRAVRADRRGARPLRALRREPRGAQRGDAHAPRRELRDRRRGAVRAASCSVRRAAPGMRRSSSASATAIATRRPALSRRPARSPS